MLEIRTKDPLPQLNPRLDVELVGRVFRAGGRVHIPNFLDAASAARIHRSLSLETTWQCVLFDGQEHRDLGVADLVELPEGERNRWLEQVARAATRGFSYRYANFRLFENYAQGRFRESYLMRLLEFINTPRFRDLMRRITGDPAIDYADGQATMYRAGDFLTAHDDALEGKHRRAAYVFSFTPDWRTDWGGLLGFPDGDGHFSEAYIPSFNSLNLFRVPTLHAVTQVSDYVTAPRYSVTGWLRQRPAAG